MDQTMEHDLFREYGDWGGPRKLFEAFLQKQVVDQHDEELRESGSTSDFATYLNDKVTKRLMWGYGEVSSSWRRYARTYSVTDYKPISFTRLGEMPNLLQVPEGGEYKDSQIAEVVGPSLSVSKFGRLFSLTREAVINDDLSQLREGPALFGRAAARTLSQAVVGKLEQASGAGPNTYDGVALFDASHNNTITAALNEQSLNDAMVKMRRQTDFSGNRIGLRPRTLIVPVELEMTARRILNSVGVPQAGNAVASGAPAHGFGGANVLQGLVDYAVEEYLTDANDWYLFADPQEAPVIAVGFLNGKETPDVMLRDPGMRLVLGGSDPYTMEFDEIWWKIRYEFGTGVFDWRGVVKAIVA